MAHARPGPIQPRTAASAPPISTMIWSVFSSVTVAPRR